MSKPTEIERLADMVSLHVATWSPGDGMTRYKFFNVPRDYDSGGELFTAGGRREAVVFLRGYAAGMVADKDKIGVCQ